MKRIFLYTFLLLIVASCNCSKKGEIIVTAADTPDSTEVIFSRLALNQIVPVDTLYLKNGKADYEMSCVEGSPEFIYIFLAGKNISTVVLLTGDKISVQYEGGEVSLLGSDESARFQKIQSQMAVFQNKFDSLSRILISTRDAGGNAELEKSLSREISSLYIAQKRASLKYVYDNPKSITAIPVLYQKVSSQLPIFAEQGDVMIFQKIADSLKTVYPSSPFVISLSDDVHTRLNNMELITRVENAKAVDFPNVSLPDINGKVCNLSDYSGKVIVLFFTNKSVENQSVFNAEMKHIYDKYSYSGLEFFYVSLDADKTAWATQVKEQSLPWVNVCDINGVYSTYAMAYNVTKIPAMFIISKDGQIIEKDVFDTSKLLDIVAREVRK